MFCDLCVEKHEAFGLDVPCDSCEVYASFIEDKKKRPTLSRFPYQTPVEEICDFCVNDIACEICEFGV